MKRFFGFKTRPSKIWSDKKGATVIEFAIVAPIMISMMFGVFQIGLAMFAYNGLRGLAGDSARYVTVQYMTNVQLTDEQIEMHAASRATEGYQLKEDRFSATAVTSSTGSGVTGVKKVTLTLNYNAPIVMPFGEISAIPLSLTKTMYLIN
jgi:Flp pilus assembly protein TadG